MADQYMFDEDETGSAFDVQEFEDPEADAQMAANTAAAEAAFNSVTEPVKLPTSKPEEFNLSGNSDYMEDVVRRMDIANYYREFLANPLFDNVNEDSRLVEAQIRQFCVSQLQILMGIRADSRPMVTSKPFPLDDKAVEALKTLIPHAQELLTLTETFAPIELEALKSLAAVALRHQGKTAPAKPPATRRLPGALPKPVTAPAPTPVVVAAPKPVPVVPVAPPLAVPAVRPTMARRGTRPTGAPVAKSATAATAAPPPIQATVTRQVEAENGEVVAHTTTVQRVQKPTGMVPFPDQRSMEVATTNLANAQISVTDPFGKKSTFNQ